MAEGNLGMQQSKLDTSYLKEVAANACRLCTRVTDVTMRYVTASEFFALQHVGRTLYGTSVALTTLRLSICTPIFLPIISRYDIPGGDALIMRTKSSLDISTESLG